MCTRPVTSVWSLAIPHTHQQPHGPEIYGQLALKYAVERFSQLNKSRDQHYEERTFLDSDTLKGLDHGGKLDDPCRRLASQGLSQPFVRL